MRRLFPSVLGLYSVLALALAAIPACNTPSTSVNNQVSATSPVVENPNQSAAAKADVIYQAFDMRFRDIKKQLPELQKLGYTYIQVSPPQKSHPSTEWWARYQPIEDRKSVV